MHAYAIYWQNRNSDLLSFILHYIYKSVFDLADFPPFENWQLVYGIIYIQLNVEFEFKLKMFTRAKILANLNRFLTKMYTYR